MNEALTCSRCSRRSSGQRRLWVSSTPPLIVQGVTLGLCPSCAAGKVVDTEEGCDRDCGGHFESLVGTYYKAEWGDASYSCWDESCVEEWIEEQDEDCGHCGQMIDSWMMIIVDGEIVEKY